MKLFTHRSTFHLALLIGALTCLTTTGCGDSTSDTSGKPVSSGTTANTSTDSGDTSDTALDTNADEPVEFEFADLVNPFDPPALDEIISGNEWIDKPVLDAVELMRERQDGEQQLATPTEVLALNNNSVANNNKIISAMGRLAQEGEVNFSAEWNRHTAGDIKSTNPLMISSTAEFDVAGLTNMGLFGFDWNFVPFASSDAVVSWQTSGDGLYDKVVMRDDLRWSDGTAITAHDVAY
nr:hypothetical protein [Pirellulaceae bacterium]